MDAKVGDAHPQGLFPLFVRFLSALVKAFSWDGARAFASVGKKGAGSCGHKY